jgi:hypothetical protein
LRPLSLLSVQQPLRGVLQGGGLPQMNVAVTVAPPDELADANL